MHIVGLFSGFFMVFISYMLYKKEIYISNNWRKSTGVVTNIEGSTRDSGEGWYSISKVTIKYSLSGKNYQFYHEGDNSLDPWEINKSVSLHYDSKNPKKVQVTSKPASFSLFLLVLSVIPFAMSYVEWEPITLSNLVIIVTFIAISVFLLFLKSDIRLLLWSFAKPYSYHIDSEPENAEQI